MRMLLSAPRHRFGAAFLAVILQVLGICASEASVFYDMKVVAQTGQAVTGGTIAGLNAPSINSNGDVAFLARVGTPSAIYIARAITGNVDLVTFAPSTTRTYSRGLQLSDNGQVVAQDASNNFTFVRLWDATGTNGGIIRLANACFALNASDGNWPICDFDAVLAFPSANNSGQGAFAAIRRHQSGAPCDLAGNTNCLVTTSSSTLTQFNTFNFPLQGIARPVIANDGTTVFRSGTTSTDPIVALPFGLGTATTLTTGFQVAGRSPGISDDGEAIAFVAQSTGFSNGLYLTYKSAGAYAMTLIAGASSGVNANGICTTGDLKAAELGFVEQNVNGQLVPSPICFKDIALDERIGVVHTPLGDPGLRGDSVTLVFVGTPSRASRDNPIMPGRPLTHSANTGIWSVRVDFDPPLDGGPGFLVHVNSPIPVVQVGDTLMVNGAAKVLTSVGIHDSAANASRDFNGNARTERRGDHRVAFFAATATEQFVVVGSHLDSDLDGLLDHWESATGGLDVDGDGVVDLKLADFGATPNHRDLFLEIDWTLDRQNGGPIDPKTHSPIPSTNEPAPRTTKFLADAMFANAPLLSGPKYGYRSDGGAIDDVPLGINLHIDAGAGVDLVGKPFSVNMGSDVSKLQGGDRISVGGIHPDLIYMGPRNPASITGIATLRSRSLQEIKEQFFGTSDKWAREFAFKYLVFADFFTLMGDTNGDGLVGDSDLNNDRPYLGAIAAASNTNGIGLLQVANNAFACAMPDVTDPGACFDLAGHAVLVTSGPPGAAGQVRRIFKNTSGVIATSEPWAVVPVGGSFVILSGNTGLGEEDLAGGATCNQGDWVSRPGNDFLVTFGAQDVTKDKNGNYIGILGNGLLHKGTVAHELGHTLGLRHGGNDVCTNSIAAGANAKPAYLSVMNYLYQMGRTAVGSNKVIDYAQPGFAVFEDWLNLRPDVLSSAHFIGNSFGMNALGAVTNTRSSPEMNRRDIEAVAGPLDGTVPDIQITAPLANAQVGLGQSIQVVASVTDNAGVQSVLIEFDVNGDGQISASESIVAMQGAGSNYSAVFVNVSGAGGTRSITVTAEDASENVGLSAVNVFVSSGPTLVLVPNVVGLTQGAAATAITTAGLSVGAITQQSSSTVPTGNVISQNPTAGTNVTSGSAVAVVVSSGPAQVSVPNVVGLSQGAAATSIASIGLVVGNVTQQASSSVPVGNVISQNPTGGTNVNMGSVVALVVSSGPAQVSVPNVVGFTQSAASNAIATVGLTVGAITQQSSLSVPVGNVISQNPTGGANVNVGSAVALLISTGPVQVSVPNVVGLTQAGASAAIGGVGLFVGAVTPQSSSSVPAGNVISQNPIGGTNVNAGSTVALVVSSGPSQVSVPNVVGLTQAGASAAIANVGLVAGSVTQQASSSVPTGNVISQNPTGGTNVNIGSSVALVVSSGPAQVSVPNVVGLTQAAATNSITSVGLVVGNVTQQSSSSVPVGNVIGQNPTGGTNVNVGSAVALVVSSGPTQVSVPNVVGLTQSAATASLANVGLVVGNVTQQSSSSAPAGNVVGQNPIGGTNVNIGSAIALVVSSGPAQVSVPNVVGLSQGAATASITNAGLVIGGVAQQSSSSVPNGNVISQNPTGGQSVVVGSAVNLVISSGPALVSVPNVVGIPQGAASTAISAAGLVVGTVSQQSSSTVANGSVIGQNPPGGQRVVASTAVDLVISSGPSGPMVCDVNGDARVDRNDITLITNARNQPASGPFDPRDPDRNGVINVLDARQCTALCTSAQCGIQ